MKVFLDANVFFDMLVLRENRLDNVNAAQILKMAVLENLEFCISPISVSTGFYITRKDKRAIDNIRNRLEHISVLSMDGADVRYALRVDLPDREDAMQMSCAYRAGCDVILTRDTGHFQNSPVPAMTPTEFLGRF